MRPGCLPIGDPSTACVGCKAIEEGGIGCEPIGQYALGFKPIDKGGREYSLPRATPLHTQPSRSNPPSPRA
jgi:hypothetical protein